MDWLVMDWREWVVLGVLITFFVGFGIVIGTAIREANKK